ncbi:MAG: hypothetical protein IME92_09575 [Proteobacteria bacterium]|nr:hypothetical protein [Pseudomonadota bacterium]
MIRRLEKRFNTALEKLDTGADAAAGAKENAEFSKQIEDLEAVKAENDKSIDALRTEVAALTKNDTVSSSEIEKLKSAQDEAQKETAALQASLEQAKAEQVAALTQASDLAEKLKNTGGATSDDTDVAELRDKLKASEAKTAEMFERVRRLRGSSRQIRADLDEGALNANAVNTALEAELEALQAQREVDLTEVNSVLAKLKPLVEGK